MKDLCRRFVPGRLQFQILTMLKTILYAVLQMVFAAAIIMLWQAITRKELRDSSLHFLGIGFLFLEIESVMLWWKPLLEDASGIIITIVNRCMIILLFALIAAFVYFNAKGRAESSDDSIGYWNMAVTCVLIATEIIFVISAVYELSWLVFLDAALY